MSASSRFPWRAFATIGCALAFSFFGTAPLLAEDAGDHGTAPEYPRMGPDIFDTRVDGAVLISSALAQAGASGKQVLLFVSANWCPWTRRLDAILHGTPALQRRLNERFVLVYLDANTRRDRQRNASVLARLGDPQKRFGIPVFVLLDAQGKVARTCETQSFAAPTDSEVAARLSGFLLAKDGCVRVKTLQIRVEVDFRAKSKHPLLFEAEGYSKCEPVHATHRSRTRAAIATRVVHDT